MKPKTNKRDETKTKPKRNQNETKTKPKRNQRGFFSGGLRPVLSDAQAEYLRHFTVEHLSPKMVSMRRGVSLTAVRKMRRWLIENNYMDARYNAVSPGRFSAQPRVQNFQANAPDYSDNWTLHGLQFDIDVIAVGDAAAYAKRVNTVFAVRGSTVMVFARKLVLKVGQVFEAQHPEKALFKASEYLLSVLRVLENDLGLILLKDRHSNIKRVKGEFSRMNDTIALKPEAARISVYSADDGKLRVKVDWSRRTMPEIEMLHSRHGFDDAVKYEDFLRDLVERNTLKLSELSALVLESQRQHVLIAKQVKSLSDVVALQFAPLSEPVEPDYTELRRWCS